MHVHIPKYHVHSTNYCNSSYSTNYYTLTYELSSPNIQNRLTCILLMLLLLEYGGALPTRTGVVMLRHYET